MVWELHSFVKPVLKSLLKSGSGSSKDIISAISLCR